MGENHSKNEIHQYLEKESTGILATHDPKTRLLRQRVMYYGVDKQFDCYLMSTKDSPKVSQILESSDISFLIFGVEEPYDDSWEMELNGHATLLTEKKDIQNALKWLHDRNPFADVAEASGVTDPFDFIKLIPKVLRFRIYKEALSGQDATVIQL